jgi:hypothetical protein
VPRVQCSANSEESESQQPVKREVCYSYGERGYDAWISVKSDYKEWNSDRIMIECN